MDAINLRPTFNTPEVDFNPDKNQFIIKGRSLPEDSKEFYEPIINWLEEYFDGKVDATNFVFEINYFNTSSSKMILDILYILRDSYNKGNKINIIWRYEEEDEELLEAGKDYETIIKMPIIIESYESLKDGGF